MHEDKRRNRTGGNYLSQPILWDLELPQTRYLRQFILEEMPKFQENNYDMKQPWIYELVQDLKTLYIKTSDREIEDSFIVLAQQYDAELIRWLSSNKEIALELGDPAIYNTFLLLTKLKRELPSGASTRDLVVYFMDQKRAVYLPYILGLATFANDPEFNHLLDPFRDILVASSALSITGDPLDEDGILADLERLKQLFSDHLERQLDSYGDYGVSENISDRRVVRRKQRIAKMFSGLLQMFSNKIAPIAEKLNKQQLAQGIRGGALANPNILKQYYPGLGSPNPIEIRWAQEWVRVVLRNLEEGRLLDNYQYIRDQVMLRTLSMGYEEMEKGYEVRQQEQAIDPSVFMGGAVGDVVGEDQSATSQEVPSAAGGTENAEEQSIMPLNVEDAKWVKLLFLKSLATFFSVFYAQMFPTGYQ